MSNGYVEVRVEEIAIGALVGLGVGLATASPIALGLPHLNPLAAGIGAWAAVQAASLWTGGLGGAALGAWWMAHQPRDTYVNGSCYLTGRAARKALQAAMRERFSKAQKARRVRGVMLGGVEWARAAEVEQTTLTALTGGGKSTLLTDTLTHALAWGDRVVLHDPSGDFIERFYGPESTVLLGGWDARAWIWNAAVDIATPALIREFATATIGRVEGENKSFYQGAATLLQGLILALRKSKAHGAWTWRDLAAVLKRPPREIAAFAVQGDERVRSAVPSAFEASKEGLSRGDGSKFAILQAGTDWITAYGAIDTPDAPRFSFSQWLTDKGHHDVRLVILNADARYAAACEAIFGAILKSAIATIASTAMPRVGPDAPGIWFLLDEARQMGRPALQSVQKLAELGRKRGLRVMVALQDASQLAAVAGETEAKPMLAVHGSRIYLRSSAPAAAEASKEAGEHVIERIRTTSDNGAVQGKTKETLRGTAILPSAFTSLKVIDRVGVEMIVQYGALYCRLLHRFQPRLPKIAPDQIESQAWINEAAVAAKQGNRAARAAGLDPEQARHETEVDAMRREGADVVDHTHRGGQVAGNASDEGDPHGRRWL